VEGCSVTALSGEGFPVRPGAVWQVCMISGYVDGEASPLLFHFN